MIIFFDTEFTGLTQNTSLISIGFISEDERSFYAEFSDFNKSQCDDWITKNVLAHTKYIGKVSQPFTDISGKDVNCFGDKDYVTTSLKKWLEQFKSVRMWADCLAYDWVLFCEIFGGALSIPKNIFYMPNDLVTLFAIKGINPDINREEFAGISEKMEKHNALWDAKVTKKCYHKLIKHRK